MDRCVCVTLVSDTFFRCEIFVVHVHQCDVRHKIVEEKLHWEHDCIEGATHIRWVIPAKVNPSIGQDTDE